LVRSDDPVAIDAPVELRLQMTRLAAGNEGAEIWCRGRVVRLLPQSNGHASYGYAVVIDQYDLVPPSAHFLMD
jgi:hypothetical protein